MNAFTGWRAVGQAMRWARQQQHITTDRTTLEGPALFGKVHRRVDNRWLIEVPIPGRFPATSTATISLEHYHRGGHADLTIHASGMRIHEMDVADAARVLRILAALRLIPESFALAAQGDPWALVHAADLVTHATKNGTPA